MVMVLNSITFKTDNKEGFKFKNQSYKVGDHMFDVLIFKDFLGKVVPRELYILPPARALSGANRGDSTPAGRTLSVGDGGNKFDFKTLRAVKAYQLLNRGKILQYRKEVLNEIIGSAPDTDMSLQDVLRIYTNNESATSEDSVSVSGQHPSFAENFGVLDEPTMAVMLGWHPEFKDILQRESTGYGTIGNVSDLNSPYFGRLTENQKTEIKLFDKYYSLYIQDKGRIPEDQESYAISIGVQPEGGLVLDDTGDTKISLIYVTPGGRELSVSISKNSWTKIYNQGEESKKDNFLQRTMVDRSLYQSIVEVVRQRNDIADELRQSAASEGSNTTVTKDSTMNRELASEIMSTPNPENQLDEPFEKNGNIHVFVETDYLLKDESLLFSRLGLSTGQASDNVPPVLNRKTIGHNVFTEEVQTALFVTGVLTSAEKRLRRTTKRFKSAAKEAGFEPKRGWHTSLNAAQIMIFQKIYHVDGKYGSGTATRVKAYQKDKRLTPDGKVGEKTYRSLMADYPSIMVQVKKVFNPPVVASGKKCDIQYITRTLAKKALLSACKFFKKTTKFQLDFNDVEIKKLFPVQSDRFIGEVTPIDFDLSGDENSDESIFFFEAVDIHSTNVYPSGPDHLIRPYGVNATAQLGNDALSVIPFVGDFVEPEGSGSDMPPGGIPKEIFIKNLKEKYIISPQRPGQYFKIEYAINKEKFNKLIMSAGTEKIVDALDAAFIAMDVAADVYNKVSEFLEDPQAAFELVGEKIEKAIEDEIAATKEVISDYKRAVTKDLGKNTRNTWSKLRRRTQRDKRNKRLKDKKQLEQSIKKIHQRKVNLLEGEVEFETRTFKKILDKVAKKMSTMAESYEDFKTESKQIETENKKVLESGEGEQRENPFSAYTDFFDIKPDVNLALESTRLKEVYGALRTFLKKNGVDFEDSFGKYLSIKFEKVVDNYGVVLGSRISTIKFKTPDVAKSKKEKKNTIDFADEDNVLSGFKGELKSEYKTLLLVRGLSQMLRKEPFSNPRIMSYLAQLLEINKTHISRPVGSSCDEIKRIPALDFISMYVYPSPSVSSLRNATSAKKKKKTEKNTQLYTTKSNLEEEAGAMLQNLKTRSKQLSERLSILTDPEEAKKLVEFQEGKTYKATDLLPLGELCTYEEIKEKFLDTFDFKSYWCEFSECLPDIPWPINFEFNFEFPRLPSLPTIPDLTIILNKLLINLIEMLVRFLCTLVNKLLDLIRLPNCDEVFEGALYGAASLVDAIKAHDKMREPVPATYDISSQFMQYDGQERERQSIQEDFKVKKKMLDSLTSYGIPEDLLSDPDNEVDANTMTDMMDDISGLLRPSEITGLLRGEPTTESLGIVRSYISTKMPSLEVYLGSESSISDFFENLGGLIDINVLRKIDELPAVLVQNRLCPEAIDVRHRVIMGNLSQDQLERAIEAHKRNTRHNTEAMLSMLENNPIQNEFQDLYNPGNPNAVYSQVPAPLMDIINSSTTSIFEVPRFSIITDVGGYTNLLYENINRKLQYEDPEFNVQVENRALESIEILIKNEAELQSALTSTSLQRKWKLREALYQRFAYDVITVEGELTTLPTPWVPGVLGITGGAGNYNANTALSTVKKTTVTILENVSQSQIANGSIANRCAEDINLKSTSTTDVYPVVKRKGDYNNALFRDIPMDLPGGLGLNREPRVNPMVVYNQKFVLSNFLPDFEETGDSLVPLRKQEGQTNAPVLTKEDGSKILEAEDLSNISAAESGTLTKQITDSIIERLTRLQESIIAHIEINMSDKNESELLPEVKKYYVRSNEYAREITDSGLFNFKKNLSENELVFDLSLPERFQSYIRYEEFAGLGLDDAFRVTIEDQVLMGSSETFYGCDSLPEEFSRPAGVISLGKKEIYLKTIHDAMRKSLDFYRTNEVLAIDSMIDGFTDDMLRSGEDNEVGEVGKVFYKQVYNKTFESLFESVLDQLASGRIFTDSQYIESLNSRLRGIKEYDENGCLIRDSRGVIDFDQVIRDATSRVVTAFENPEFHPSRAEFNEDSIGPFELGIIHACIYLMINVMLIEFALRGGIAFSFFDAEELFGVNEENKTSELFRNYIVKFIYKSLGSLVTTTRETRATWYNPNIPDALTFELFRMPFLEYCIEYVKSVDPNTIDANATEKQQQMSAIEYIVEDVISDGNLVSMINAIFKGDPLIEPVSFAESYLKGVQLLPVPEESLSVESADGTIQTTWLQRNVQDVPDLSKKGRFFLQKYIRVSGPAASKDLSEYTFTPEFLSFKDQLLRGLRSTNQDNTDVPLFEDPEDIANKIEDRIEVIQEMDPLPGAEDDNYRDPNGFETELVSISELQKYLNDTYQNSFNQELCDLLGLIYREDPQDVCFLMPIQFERYPGKHIKRNIKYMTIDRGFLPPNSPPQQRITGVTIRSKRRNGDLFLANQRFQSAFPKEGRKGRIVDKYPSYSSTQTFNDIFDLSLLSGERNQSESTAFRPGIFSKAGRLGNPGNMRLRGEDVPKYYILPQDICEMSSDYETQEKIDSAFIAYAEGSTPVAKEDLLLDSRLTAFASTFSPDVPSEVSDGRSLVVESLGTPSAKKINVETSEVLSAMDESYNEYQDFGSAESVSFPLYLEGLEQEKGRSNGVKLKSFDSFSSDAMEEISNLDNGIFPWKMGLSNQEAFEESLSLENVSSLGGNPDLQNSEKLLGPNNVYEEWTHYLIEDPGYVFDKPGESLHCPESMGSMIDTSQLDTRHTRDIETPADDREMLHVRFHWINQLYNHCVTNIEDALNISKKANNGAGSASSLWGWGATPNNPAYIISPNARENRRGWSTYRTIFRFERAPDSSDNDVDHRDIYPKEAPIMTRPLGYQSEALEHEDTNELRANEYVMPVYILVTRVDYKIDDTILHTDTFIGSKFQDPLGIMRGADISKEHKNGLVSGKRRKVLSEAINRLTMEWVDNSSKSLILSSGDVKRNLAANRLIDDSLNRFARTFNSTDGTGTGGGLSEEEIMTILYAAFKTTFIREDIFFRFGQRNEGLGGWNMSRRNFMVAMRNRRNAGVITKLADALTGGRMTKKYIVTSRDDDSRPTSYRAEDGIMYTANRYRSKFKEAGPLFNLLLPDLISDEKDFGLRPLSRGYRIKTGELVQGFDLTRHKTNMCTTSKIYSAAAIMASGFASPRILPIYPEHDDSAPNDSRVLEIEKMHRDEVIEELIARSIAVDVTATGWENAQEIFDFSENDPEREVSNLSQICNQYTEKYLNTRTYEGFWGFTSSPQYLRGFSFVQLLKTEGGMGHGLPYGSEGQFVPGDSDSSDVIGWSDHMRIYDTFPPICGQEGDTPDTHSNVDKLSDHYALERLPYPAGFQGTFAGKQLPAFEEPEHLMVADGRSGSNLESDIETFKRNRGDDNIGPIQAAIAQGRQIQGFKSYLVNKSVQLLFKSDYDERYYWSRAGDALATPMDEVGDMSNYGTSARTSGVQPIGIFEKLNAELREELRDRLNNLIKGSKYTVGLRLVHVLSDEDTEAIDRIIESDARSGATSRAFDLLLAEERLTKTTIQNSEFKYNYVVPVVSTEMDLENCTLNWKRVASSAESMFPELIKTLSKDQKYLNVIESSFPLQRFSLLSGLYSVMALSTQEGFEKFMESSKYSIVNIFETITKRGDFENVPSGAELWMKMNGYRTSVGPQPPLSEVLGQRLDGFISSLIENALMTPVIMIRNFSGVLDPAYKSMMKEKGVAPGKIDSLKYSSIATSGLKSGRMKNGLTCDGNYVPVNLGFPRDVAANLFPLPNRDFFRALRKFVATMRRYKRGGTSDSYGDFLGPFGALALSLPELPGDVRAREQAAKREQVGQPFTCPPIEQTPLEEQDNGDNSEEQDN